MDDLKELKATLREVVACGYMPAATRVALDQAFGAIVTMETRITTLEAQLAEARGEPDRIVAYLESERADWRKWSCSAESVALGAVIKVIAARAYVKENDGGE